jgi:UDP-N-acetylmuramate--alanine ligase
MMALAMARAYGIPATDIKEALISFKGIRRRFSYQIRKADLIYIDDYAHHPTEIASIYQAVRELYPNKEIAVVFQPHLYSRTRDFADGFADSLSVFDHIFLMEIYPARELPIPGINAAFLYEKISNPNKKIVTKEALVDALQKVEAQVIVTLGAGDIGALVEPIKNALNEKK